MIAVARPQANLQPNQAVQALTDRVKRISKVNQEIADWLQVRRQCRRYKTAGLIAAAGAQKG